MASSTVTETPGRTDREFKAELTLLDGVMLVVGAMIGSGIFKRLGRHREAGLFRDGIDGRVVGDSSLFPMEEKTNDVRN